MSIRAGRRGVPEPANVVGAPASARNGAARPGVERSLSGSSFYAAMRILPQPQRGAVFEIYRFCRAVDDIADGRGGREARLDDLARWRADIVALFAGAPPVRLRALREAVQAFDLRREDFLAVLDGMEMDARASIRAPDLALLDLYCDRVACAVGRLCVRVFGIPAIKGPALAAHLGRALQLTNILRDLDEDSGFGRLYLPRELLLDAGIVQTDPPTVLGHPALGRACEDVARLAREHYAGAERLMSDERTPAVRAPRLMATIYGCVLERLVARGWSPPRRPVRLGRGTLLWIAFRDTVSAAMHP